MSKGINVLSLFDGMSCGQIALERAGIEVKNYFASEIDKHAIAVTMRNYPNTIQLGDVAKIDLNGLPKIDLILAGSPCQGFSMTGKKLNFNDERSSLFFEFIRILNNCREHNKDVKFILENVRMKKEWLYVIDDYVGLRSKAINSSLVSAQNRPRFYWSNIEFGIPEDKNIKLADVLDLLPESDTVFIFKNCVRHLVVEQFEEIKKSDKIIHQLIFQGRGGYQDRQIGILKAPCITTSGFTLVRDKTNNIRLCNINELERLQTVPDGYTLGVPITKARHMLGNGWTVDVIAHILKHANL